MTNANVEDIQFNSRIGMGGKPQPHIFDQDEPTLPRILTSQISDTALNEHTFIL
jgi:hypothetical protein